MKYERIPKTDIKVSKIGFGTRTLNTRPESLEYSQKLIDSAIDLGINFFVTTAHYSNGQIEERLGHLLSGIRDKVVVSTSGGISHKNGKIIVDSSRQALEKSIQTSLNRLQTDYLDHFEIHIYDPFTPLEETLGFLREYMDSDIIRSVGTSSFQPEILKRWEEHLPTSLVQLPLNPMQQKAYQLALPACQEFEIGLTIYGAFFMGLFCSSINKTPETIDQRINAPTEWTKCLINLNQALTEQSQETGLRMSELILNWVLSHDCITSVLVGTNNIDHLKENVSVFESPASLSTIEETAKIIRSNYERLYPKILPKFEQVVKTIKKISPNNYAIISDLGIKVSVPRFYPPGTKLYFDIETAEVLDYDPPS
ncbi:MAG: aldo/keto reductase [Promethearchaeota archaeon]